MHPITVYIALIIAGTAYFWCNGLSAIAMTLSALMGAVAMQVFKKYIEHL
jgi:hypothetical protein